EPERSAPPARERRAERRSRLAIGTRSAPVPATSVDSAPTDVSMDAITWTNNHTITGAYQSPFDASAAAGPTDVVVTTNTSMWTNNKIGFFPNQTSLGAFFGSLSPAGLFDPVVEYDAQAGRFVIVVLDRSGICEGKATDTSRIFVAVSLDSGISSWVVTS